MKEESGVFQSDKSVYNKKVEPTPVPERNIGIDTHNTVIQEVIGDSKSLDIGTLESFTGVSQSRDRIYTLIDEMCQDSKVAAVLETYVEDATETNDRGKIVWCESSDDAVNKYITYLLEVMNVDKYAYGWIYSLCKYGDLYLRLYRDSDYKDDVLAKDMNSEEISKRARLIEQLEREDMLNSQGDFRGRENLREAVNIAGYREDDHYAHYMEIVENPAELFELTRLGKTYAYIKADTAPYSINDLDVFGSSYYRYSFRRGDVTVHGPTDYVHAALENNGNRSPEEIRIFLEDGDGKTTKDSSYKVRRGQSLLYNTFKIWRELKLLEDSVILNRITKSSIIRLVEVEVGDMPREEVGPHLQGVKSLIEQKSALNAGQGMDEYTNPGPVENSVYVSTRNGKGKITIDTLGGDVEVGKLADLDYFQSAFYGNLRVPKQYFGATSDNAGFSGGQSLAIISSRYAKMIKRIQNAFLQALTDAINLMLVDKNLTSYLGKFTLRMQEPTTQEAIDRRDNLASKIQIVRDTMDMLNDVEDPVTKLKALKSLLTSVYTDNEIISIIQKEIDSLEEEQAAEKDSSKKVSDEDESKDLGGELGLEEPAPPAEKPTGTEQSAPEVTAELPTPSELNPDLDFSNNDQEF